MKITPESYNAYFLLHRGILALQRAEKQGIRIDIDYCETKQKSLEKKIVFLEQQLKNTKFYRRWAHSAKGKLPNLYSNAQLAWYLYKVLKLNPPDFTQSGQGSTDEETLLQLNIPELMDLLEIRKLKKIKDTYLDGFIKEQVDGIIHPSFNLHLVKTFRSSSDSPNFQNIPKRDKEAMNLVRDALYARPDHLLMEVDYSGLEVRIASCYHKDPTMLKYIRNPKSDMHRDMAEQIFMIKYNGSDDHKILRAATKNGFVFPEFYGDYYKNCAINMACGWGKLPEKGRWKSGQGISLNGSFLADHFIAQKIVSLEHFTKHVKGIEMDFWRNRFPIYQRWKEKWWALYQKTGYIDMHTGFRCSGVMSRNDVTNYAVQGSAFHCLLWSFIRMDQLILENKWNTRLIGQIHDSIVLDVDPKELEVIVDTIKKVTCKELPEAWRWINVPLDVEIETTGINEPWSKIKPLNLNEK